MVNTFLACKRKERALSPEGYWALHWAAKMEHAEVVNAILLNKDVNAAVLMSVEKSLIKYRLSYGFDTSFDWSDGSDIGPFYKASFTPLQLASLYGDETVVKILKGRLEATIEDDTGGTALRIATEMRRDEILKILTDIPEVEKEAKRLNKIGQLQIGTANAVLVVAALTASVTFDGGLQPPLGTSPYFGSANLHVGAPIPPGMYPSFASVEGHPSMPLFCIVNTLSFVFAITALGLGAWAAMILPHSRKYIGVVVPFMGWLLASAHLFMGFSLVFLMSTFQVAGTMVFPPIPIYFFIYFSIPSIVGIV